MKIRRLLQREAEMEFQKVSRGLIQFQKRTIQPETKEVSRTPAIGYTVQAAHIEGSYVLFSSLNSDDTRGNRFKL